MRVDLYLNRGVISTRSRRGDLYLKRVVNSSRRGQILPEKGSHQQQEGLNCTREGKSPAAAWVELQLRRGSKSSMWG
jgi:hypothetical protein